MSNVASPQAQKKQYSAKVVLVGASGVGKTCLGCRFSKNEFLENSGTTIVATFMSKAVEFPRYKLKLEIWDTAGQERFHSLAHMYYRNASAAVIVYDVSKRDTFGAARNWLNEVRREGMTSSLIAVCGNKSDLIEQRTVTEEEGKKFASENEVLFFETSALTGRGVNEMFTFIAQSIPVTMLEEETEYTSLSSPELSSNPRATPIKLKPSQQQQQFSEEKSKCCA